MLYFSRKLGHRIKTVPKGEPIVAPSETQTKESTMAKEEKAAKFAKKGSLVVDTDTAKLSVVGQDESRASAKKASEKVAGKAVKATKTKPEAKAAKKVAKAEKTESTKEKDTRKITLLTKENPKREGSASYERFELYRKAKTVADFLEAGGTTADIRYDEAAGHIKVA